MSHKKKESTPSPAGIFGTFWKTLKAGILYIERLVINIRKQISWSYNQGRTFHQFVGRRQWHGSVKFSLRFIVFILIGTLLVTILLPWAAIRSLA